LGVVTEVMTFLFFRWMSVHGFNEPYGARKAEGKSAEGQECRRARVQKGKMDEQLQMCGSDDQKTKIHFLFLKSSSALPPHDKSYFYIFIFIFYIIVLPGVELL
jgi:hypothetical protein